MSSFSARKKSSGSNIKASNSKSKSNSERHGESNGTEAISLSLQHLAVDMKSDSDIKEDTLVKNFDISPPSEHVEQLEESTPYHITTIMKQAMEPVKGDIIREVDKIARKMTRNSILKGYILQKRGSLYSPLLDHISDADVQLISKSSGIVSVAQCEYLLQFAHQNFFLGYISSIRWQGIDGSEVEISYGNFDMSATLQDSPGYNAFIVTGVYRFANGFLIPVDLALSCGGEKSEPQAHRCAKIMKKMQAGDFAKVLQKIRALFRKGVIRDSLVAAINAYVGKLRFVVKQLEMIVSILKRDDGESNVERRSSTEEIMVSYMRDTLRFPSNALSVCHLLDYTALAECERELQRRALTVLTCHLDAIEAKLLPYNSGKSIEEYLYLDEAKYPI